MVARKRFDLALRYLASFVLVLVALQQIYMVHTSNLSVWKGGGFGMFAAIDGLHHRVVRAYLLTGSGEVRARVRNIPSRPGSLEHAFAEARAIPSERRLQELAARIGRMTWIVDEAADGPGSEPPVSASGGNDYEGPNSPADGGAIRDSVIADPATLKVRGLRRGDRPPAGAHVLQVSGVRVEVLRVQFDRENTRVIRTTLAEQIWRRP